MDKVELMNRKDTKFFFDKKKLPAIIDELLPHYKLLEINNTRLFSYKNIYFDTSDFFLYQQHHNKRVNRYKIRIRQYVESNLSFLEIKFKNNTGRTIKSRIIVDNFSEHLDETSVQFIESKTPFK